MKKILIADDEHKILMTLEYSFRKIGYEVFIARDGTEVLELLKTTTPDVILLDIMMPNLDGYSTLKEIKKSDQMRHSKIIFLSAKTNPKDIAKGLDLGADAYVTKPYSIKKLIQQIELMLE
ncbi:response regulator transcription factor [Epilithonimonas tenax]|uniref:response regulator transcription factor n=1 Tax=Epilithonimonas tenax TaxID=191577 RepID=UPI000408A245|nr:response regulator [Epilithonimonas tenax]